MPAAKPKLQNEYRDNTMLSDYKTCPRKYYFRHVKGWRGEGIAIALKFGLAWHSALAIVWMGWKKMPPEKLLPLAFDAFMTTWVEEGMPSEDEWKLEHEEQYAPRTPGVAKEMLVQYVLARKHILDKAKVHAVELPFAVPIFPDKKNMWYIGKIDVDTTIDGDNIIIEHKSTSEYKKDGGFKTSYLESWSPNSQCEGYLYQSKLGKRPARYAWVDASLVHRTVHDKHKFIPIAASGASLDAFLWEMRDWIMRIQSEMERLPEQDAKQTHMTAFPKNTESCSHKYGLCPYISICRSVPRPDKMNEPPAGFVLEYWSPFDILKMEKIGMKK